MSWDERIRRANARIDELGRRRRIRAPDPDLVTFASNDYLGLTRHPRVVEAARAQLSVDGTGAGAARLVVGARPVHAELEAALASHHRRDAALLFPTGYQANLGVLTALASTSPDVVVYSDELNHASIIDACRLSKADTAIYRHRDLAHLAELLDARSDRPAIVVSDSVFSMDGDVAPLDDLARLVEGRDALLVVDEAHAVLGPSTPPAAVVVGTLSKTLGTVGGYVAADADTVALLTSTARSFIFTTAGAPADAAAALAALEVLRSDEGDDLRSRLRANVDRLSPGHPTPIVPVVLGDERRALEASAELARRGLLVPAIRPPTVAPGTCRLRVALSAVHTEDQVDQLRDALDELGIAP